MDLISQLSRQHRIPFDRSISEHRYDDHRFREEIGFYKGHQNLKKNSYHIQGTISIRFLCADNSLIINLSLVSHMFHFPLSSKDSSHYAMQSDRANDLSLKSLQPNRMDQKVGDTMEPPPPRR